MDFELTREDTMIRDAIRKWVSKECPRDVVSELDENNEFPRKLVKKLSKLGFSGMTVPEAYEGEGENLLGACLVAEEIAYSYPVLSQCYINTTFFAGAIFSRLGSKKQKETFLPKMAEGKTIVALALPEKDDPDAEFVETAAKQGDQEYIINGTKFYVPLADQADLILLLARTEENDGSALTFFCLESGREGISTSRTETMGNHGAGYCEVRLENVKVPVDSVLGGESMVGKASEQLKWIRDMALLSSAAIGVGMARGAFDYALQHAKQRVQFGQPIGRFPAINRMFAESTYHIEAARLLLYKAAWTIGRGKNYSRNIAMAKCFAAESAVESAMKGLQVLGGYGYTMEYDIQRYVRDSVALFSDGASLEFLKEGIGASLGLA